MRVEDRLRVSVVASGPVAAEDAPTSDIDGVEPWALLRGLIDDFDISTDAGDHRAVDVLAARLSGTRSRRNVGYPTPTYRCATALRK